MHNAEVQCGQTHHGVAWHRDSAPCCWRAFQNDDQASTCSRSPTAATRRDLRSPRWSGERLLRDLERINGVHQGRQAPRTRMSRLQGARRRCRHPHNERFPTRVFEASAWLGLGAPKNTPDTVIRKLNNEINAALADSKMRPGLPILLTGCEARRPISRNLSPIDVAKWAKVIKFARTQVRLSVMHWLRGNTFTHTSHGAAVHHQHLARPVGLCISRDRLQQPPSLRRRGRPALVRRAPVKRFTTPLPFRPRALSS
jgi:hypothetical protein